MVKKHTTINIDHEVLEKAKGLGFNISSIAEDALKVKSGQTLGTPDDELSCFKCGKKMRKATAKNMNGLFWLNPEEVWCCPECDSRRTRSVVVAV